MTTLLLQVVRSSIYFDVNIAYKAYGMELLLTKNENAAASFNETFTKYFYKIIFSVSCTV